MGLFEKYDTPMNRWLIITFPFYMAMKMGIPHLQTDPHAAFWEPGNTRLAFSRYLKQVEGDIAIKSQR